MSNSFNAQRGLLKRPKICKPPLPPPPPPIPPPVTKTCEIRPTSATFEEGATPEFELRARKSDLPIETEVQILVTSPADVDWFTEVVDNDNNFVFSELQNELEVGVHTIVTLFTFSDSSTCVFEIEVTVTEEE